MLCTEHGTINKVGTQMLIKDSSADEHNTSLKENLLLINIKTVEDLVISLSSKGRFV